MTLDNKTVLLITNVLLLYSSSLFSQSSIAKGKALYESKKYAEAEKILDGVSEKNTDYAAAQYYLGRIAFDKNEYDDAADFFEEATDANPNVAEYYKRLGDAYGGVAKNGSMLTQVSMAGKLKKAWEKVVELDPKSVDARTSLIGFYSQAPGIMGGSMDKAKAMAIDVMKLNAAEGHWQMGSILAKEKNTIEAEKEFSKMLQANPEYSRNLGGYYADQKQYDKAFELFDETLKKNPDDYGTLYRFGKASAQSSLKLDRGEECLKKYLTYHPTYSEPSLAGANMRLAQIKEKKGNKAEAKRYFEVALKLDDSLKEAKAGLERTSK
jgi:tetratricopeptide (TPR) repeat protein